MRERFKTSRIRVAFKLHTAQKIVKRVVALHAYRVETAAGIVSNIETVAIVSGRYIALDAEKSTQIVNTRNVDPVEVLPLTKEIHCRIA